MLDALKRNTRVTEEKFPLTKDEKAQIVRQYQDNVTMRFDPQVEIAVESYQSNNFGLNDEDEARRQIPRNDTDPASFITPETQKILKALNQVPMIQHTDTLEKLSKLKNRISGVTQGFRVNSEIVLTA